VDAVASDSRGCSPAWAATRGSEGHGAPDPVRHQLDPGAARPGRTRRCRRWLRRVRQIQRLPRRTSARVTASGCRFMSSAQAVGPSPMLRTSTEVGAGAKLGRARCPRRPPANLRLEELALLDGGQLDLLAGGGLRSLPTGFPAPPHSGPEVLTSTVSHPC
jgi:hypothetical protein